MVNKKAYIIAFSILFILSLLAGIALIILSVKNIQDFTFSVIAVAVLSASGGAEITLSILQYISTKKNKS